ncbi:MAG TPA: hypothetical protein VF588_18725 [Pyrinomonadaceae bacterium]|jgi:uncharacterized membrane protein
MAGERNVSEWAAICGLFAAWLLLIFWLKRARRAAAARGAMTGEAAEVQRRVRAWGPIFLGVILAGVAVFKWGNIPRGNEPVVAFMVAAGALCVLYGVYRLYRLGK